MATLVLRIPKGTPLTNQEMDDNLSNLNNEIATKLNTSSYTAADVLTKIKTVDGAGSGLDADVLDGMAPTNANTPSTVVNRDASGNFSAGTITASLTGNASGTAANVTGIVAVVNGGTGANNAASARLNLGVDAAGDSLAFAIALG
jgi:hypothetical protein